jgi:GntR family transcriptional regulator
MNTLPGQREKPQYQKLAAEIRDKVASGEYMPGDRIPSESAFCKSSGLSLLTVRQAMGVLVDEGLLLRYPGKGTFIAKFSPRKASFVIDGLYEKAARTDNVVTIIETSVKRAPKDLALTLKLKEGDPVGFIKKTMRSGEWPPFLIQESHFILDPLRPIVEAELEQGFLKGVLKGAGRGLIRTVKMTLYPVNLSSENARLMEWEENVAAFKLCYVFFDSEASPFAAGAFYIAPLEELHFSSVLGDPLPGEET